VAKIEKKSSALVTTEVYDDASKHKRGKGKLKTSLDWKNYVESSRAAYAKVFAIALRNTKKFDPKKCGIWQQYTYSWRRRTAVLYNEQM